MGTVIVETRSVGQARGAVTDLPLPPGTRTLRELLGELVVLELREYVDRRLDESVFRVLTPADLERAAGTGRYAVEPRGFAEPPTAQAATRVALEAFVDGLFVVFVDDAQVTDLDQPLVVEGGTRLLLVRLVALAGR
jgi:hypothetical protein